MAFAPNRASKQEETKNSEAIKTDNGIEIIAAEIKYFNDFKGYLAKPAKTAIYPGIILIHEFWGLNDNIKTMAQELAKEDYVVLAVDLFGEVAGDAERAAHLSSSIDQTAATANMRAAIQYLRDNEKVFKVASLGWCFGGGQSLQLALSGEPIDATIIYYGRLTSDKARLAQINWPILGIFAGEDRGITADSVKQFEASLAELNKVKEIYIYPGVNHAFANPSGANYAPQETKDAWEKTLIFLEKYLKTSYSRTD